MSKYRQEVIFDGVKVFWKTRAHLEVTLVEHFDSNAIEVIGFDPAVKDEAPRLYVDTVLLGKALSEEDIEDKIADASLLKKSMDKARLRAQCIQEMKKEYLLARVQMNTDCVHFERRPGEPGPWYISLTPHAHDAIAKNGLSVVQCMKPEGLVPAQVKRLFSARLTYWEETMAHFQALATNFRSPDAIPSLVGAAADSDELSSMSDASSSKASAMDLDKALRPFRASLLFADDSACGHRDVREIIDTVDRLRRNSLIRALSIHQAHDALPCINEKEDVVQDMTHFNPLSCTQDDQMLMERTSSHRLLPNCIDTPPQAHKVISSPAGVASQISRMSRKKSFTDEDVDALKHAGSKANNIRRALVFAKRILLNNADAEKTETKQFLPPVKVPGSPRSPSSKLEALIGSPHSLQHSQTCQATLHEQPPLTGAASMNIFDLNVSISNSTFQTPKGEEDSDSDDSQDTVTRKIKARQDKLKQLIAQGDDPLKNYIFYQPGAANGSSTLVTPTKRLERLAKETSTVSPAVIERTPSNEIQRTSSNEIQRTPSKEIQRTPSKDIHLEPLKARTPSTIPSAPTRGLSTRSPSATGKVLSPVIVTKKSLATAKH